MNFGVIVFPGSNCDRDCGNAVENLGHNAQYIWHDDSALPDVDCVILPGGFSYGDYLRSGAMAARSPIMRAVKNFADEGGLVIGICNGFQILQEAGMLAGALMRNEHLQFVCRYVHVRVENNELPFTCACRVGEILKIPVAHMDGRFFADKKDVSRLDSAKGVAFRYCDKNGVINDDSNFNGSVDSIAGIVNGGGNVCGMMPHPERCTEDILGNTDGIKIFESITAWQERKFKR